MNAGTVQAILRNIPTDMNVAIGVEMGSGTPNETISGRVFHGIADYIDDLQLDIIKLKAKLYDTAQ